MKNKIYSTREIYFEKIRNYCTYQERCQQEVIQKMKELKINSEWQDEIIIRLIQEKYIDEERFTRAVVSGKHRIKHWGRIKISNFLIQKNILPKLIQTAMTVIDEEEYYLKIKFLILKKTEEIQNSDQTIRFIKLKNYLLQKGYESELITKALKEYKEEKEA